MHGVTQAIMKKARKTPKDEEVNLCLMANSRKGEYDIRDASPEYLQEAMKEVFIKFKITRKELKEVKN